MMAEEVNVDEEAVREMITKNLNMRRVCQICNYCKKTIEAPPILEEAENEIEQLKDNKHPGLDNLLAELLKYGGKETVNILYEIFKYG
jgi:hypothetical protein